jgi:hypothetical protein
MIEQMVASKFLFDDGEDDEVFNDEWASSANIEVKELNRLEREFLEAMEWSCFVDCDTFLKQLSKVEALISLHQSIKRGGNGMTYNELLALFNYSSGKNRNDKLWSTIITNITKVLLVSSFAYWAAVFAIITSTTIPKTSIENTHSLINSSIAWNHSGLVYRTGLEDRVSEFTLHEIPLSIYSIKKAKSDNVLFIQSMVNNKNSYKKVVTNIQISLSSEQFISNPSVHNSMPNKYQSFKYIYKY